VALNLHRSTAIHDPKAGWNDLAANAWAMPTTKKRHRRNKPSFLFSRNRPRRRGMKKNVNWHLVSARAGRSHSGRLRAPSAWPEQALGIIQRVAGTRRPYLARGKSKRNARRALEAARLFPQCEAFWLFFFFPKFRLVTWSDESPVCSSFFYLSLSYSVVQNWFAVGGGDEPGGFWR